MQLASVIRYFRACYREDNRRTTLWNIFSQRVEHRIFAEGEENLLAGTLSQTPVDVEKGRAARAAAHLYRKEKDLLYAAFFVTGVMHQDGQPPQPMCAPLLLHTAQLIERDGFVFAMLDPGSWQLNHCLLDCLQEEGEELPSVLSEVLRRKTVGMPELAEVAAVLKATVPHLDTDLMLQFPQLVSEKVVRAAFNNGKKEGGLQVLPASALALVKKSVGTRGVLNELAAIADAGAYSAPLRFLFGEAHEQSQVTVDTGRVPAVLSKAQQQVVASAAVHPMTLVIGPPGTGKSYTIASLAMEHMSRGQTVLIASKMNHAVDVVGRKIEAGLGVEGCVVRGGRHVYLRDLKRYVRQLLSGMHTDAGASSELNALKQDLGMLDRKIEGETATLTKRIQQAQQWGGLLAQPSSGVLDGWRERFVRWRAARATPLWKLTDLMEALTEGRIEKTTQMLRLQNTLRIAVALKQHRSTFVNFDKAIRARTGGKQEALFEQIDVSLLLRAFPVWLVNLADVHEVLPLQKELFDLVIIDEATQCDIASCLPVLHRARRAVIVGDPEQLRHISFLSRDRQQALQQKHRSSAADVNAFDYREQSILDLANERITSQEQVCFLNEHYRSAPAIIHFSNRRFYGDALHVMTESPSRRQQQSLFVHTCDGRRGEDGVNRGEADRLMADVVRQVAAERSLEDDLGHSIGILCPFRDQVDYIADELTKQLPVSDLERHELLLGTAHTFQGEERDVMYLGFAIDATSHAASLRFLERTDVFNVAITRARAAQHLYTSIAPEQLPPDSLLGAYLRHATRKHELSDQPNPPHRDAFAAEVQAALEAEGAEVRAAYPVAGLPIDLVVTREAHSVGIDLIGHPGVFADAFPLERYRIFARAGLHIVPISYAAWLLSPEVCLQAVLRSL